MLVSAESEDPLLIRCKIIIQVFQRMQSMLRTERRTNKRTHNLPWQYCTVKTGQHLTKYDKNSVDLQVNLDYPVPPCFPVSTDPYPWDTLRTGQNSFYLWMPRHLLLSYSIIITHHLASLQPDQDYETVCWGVCINLRQSQSLRDN